MSRSENSRRIGAIIELARKSRLEFAAQVILMVGAGTVAWITTGLSFIPLWIALHFGLIAIERRVALRLRDSSSPWALAGVLFAHLLVGIGYAAMPVYLWLHGGGIYEFVGMVLLLGSIMNVFLVRAQVWYLALCFVIPDALAILVIAIDLARETASPAEQLTILTVAAAIIAYLGVAVLQSARAYQRHNALREQLAQARKMEAIGNLAGGMAHDFNNILNVIGGTLELVQAEDDLPSAKALTRRASEAVERGSALIRQVLSFARKSPLAPRSVDPARVLEVVERMAGRMICERIVIEVTREPDLPAIRVDEGALVTALLNLVLNARDAIEDGGRIVIKAAVERSGARGTRRRVVFSVRDDGRGIAPDLIGRVSEPFFTTKPKGEGTGLGLSSVAGFAAQSGGVMLIDSDEGRGTEVKICLPLDPAPQPISTVSRPVTKEPGRRSVLVVEDQRELLELLLLYFERTGHEVHGAASGDAALTLFEQGLRPEIVISDVVMPGQVQGRELAALLRGRFPAMKIVLMSGFDESAFRGAPLPEGVVQLAKPVRLADLAALIERLP